MYQPAVLKLILTVAESTLGPMLQHCRLPFDWCAHMAPQKQCCYYYACWFIVFSRISFFLVVKYCCRTHCNRSAWLGMLSGRCTAQWKKAALVKRDQDHAFAEAKRQQGWQWWKQKNWRMMMMMLKKQPQPILDHACQLPVPRKHQK